MNKEKITSIPFVNHQENLDFSKITFYTKDKVDLCIIEDTYEIASILKDAYDK